MATYRSHVEYLEKCNYRLIERNADEFGRISAFLQGVEPDVRRAKTELIWKSDHRPIYDARVKDAEELVVALSAGFNRACRALMSYANGVEEAKLHYTNGLNAVEDLAEVLTRLQSFQSAPYSPRGEPMQQWEAFEAAGELAESTALIDSGYRAYRAADGSFSQAKSVEERFREQCLTELRAAYSALPDFRGDFSKALALIGSIPELQSEMIQAGARDHTVHLSGAGLKSDVWPTVDPGAAVSEKLESMRNLRDSLPSSTPFPTYQIIGKTDQETETEWIRNNRELIEAIARESGLPPDLIIGTILKEDPSSFPDDNRREDLREWDIVSGHPDQTSFGQTQVQIRTAAEVLGYDPAALTDQQREEIRNALKDPVQNIMIAAEYLEQLKAETDFADTPAHQLTDDQIRELAARYNGGPGWQLPESQADADEFMNQLNKARKELQ